MDEKILIVSASEKGKTSLERLLRRHGYTNIDFSVGVMEAKRTTMRTVYDIVIINSPLKDGLGFDFAMDFLRSALGAAIVIKRHGAADIIAEKAENDGVFVLNKPLEEQEFLSAMRLSLAHLKRQKKIEEKTKKYQKKYEELRVVSRAKCMLIEKESMTEQDAHRYIEKRAMDSRENKIRVANDIIKNYI